MSTSPGRRPPRHWMDLSPTERVDAVRALGLPAFTAKQISTHWFIRLEDDPAHWTDLPAASRGTVAETFFPRLMEPVEELTADRGTTVKTAWRLHDGAVVESVLMRYPHRTTICISSEAGCAMGCPFCATGQGGLQRNLSAAEIVAQVLHGARLLAQGRVPGGPGRINNVVFMGMGEPMANYAAVLAAVRELVRPAPDGLGISARGLTVSTVGMVPRIRRLTAEGIPVTLAVSLHAPDDELRDELVPLNQHFDIDQVLDAAWEYARVTRRRVSIEYALIKDINDQAWRADLLARRLAERGDWGWVHVNLIPLNPTPGSKWTASRPEDEEAFVRHLRSHGVPVTVRDTRGREIDGACGQLAATLDGGQAARRAPGRASRASGNRAGTERG
ncbi:23S rRNA (adenine(2503)-C(2))-methyltransferase RlmN [Propionibacterium australiense]|uniref:Probable dual-specificity RNA methyltransferase RlmN n=1 Tax=Propionibacterium australiense TaxID=119981 RepID=A0A8B3FMS2_9ACTN|nr:23S rRNA (adenine(2503)-C(2))-methyltransferase RlmN [Propionibacterium australiense]RLP11190.1 dual-specificity RNA methyltransferase RlmN [Propionibacterium australiense]